MGRPLNKRFFDPVPSSNGEGVASVTVTDNDRGNYAVLATATFTAPELPSGTTATGSVVMRLRGTVSVNAGGTGYAVGNMLTIFGGATTAGTYTTQAAIRVESIDVGTGAITAFSAFTVSPSSRGAYTVLPVRSASSTTNLQLTGGAGSGATANVTWEVSSVTVTASGAGYVDAPTLGFSAGTGADTASGTAALTTTGTNVILATAFVVGGTAPLDADIIKQTSTNEYLMETTEGQSVVTLVADDTPEEGQASITATDALGGAYWVMKLTSRLAVLEQKVSGTGVYDSGETAPWTLESTSIDPSGQTVQITSA
jgi:hypothetical protein